MKTKLLRPLAVLCFLAVMGPSVSFGETVFNSFGDGQEGWDYDLNAGWFVAGDDVPMHPGVAPAASFDVDQTGLLTDIWLAMRYVVGDGVADVVTVYLVPNPENQPPVIGDALEQWTITDLDAAAQWTAPVHLVSDGSTTLDAGQAYWLVAVPDPTTLCIWHLNVDDGLTCYRSTRQEGATWGLPEVTVASAFRVDVLASVAVEPSNWSSVKNLFD